MIDTKINKEKVLSLDTEEWLEWVHPFKVIIPPYPRLSRATGLHHNTISNVMRGLSDNKEAKRVIVEAIEEALGELQQAALS